MNRSLRVLLFAHHQVGLAAFHGLREAGHEIIACFTHPTVNSWIPSLRGPCNEAGISCWEEIPNPGDASRFRESRPDLIVSAGYQRRVSLPFLALPRWGAINAHLAPLPRYRGALPIRWGIINGENSWAITIHAMTHNYNEGGILRERFVALRESDNAYDLHLRCSQIAAQTMREIVNDIAAGGGDLRAQDVRGVRCFNSTLPCGGRIDWNQSAIQLADFVRAMDLGRDRIDGTYEHLSAPAKATVNGQEVGLWRARAGGTMSAFPPGTITRSDGEVWVQTGKGHLVLEQLCDSRGQDFRVAEYLNTHRIRTGESFDTHHSWNSLRQSQLEFAA